MFLPSSIPHPPPADKVCLLKEENTNRKLRRAAGWRIKIAVGLFVVVSFVPLEKILAAFLFHGVGISKGSYTHMHTHTWIHTHRKEAVGWVLGMSEPWVRNQLELGKDNTQENSGKPLLEHRAMEDAGDKSVLLLPALTCLAAWTHAVFPYLSVVSPPPLTYFEAIWSRPSLYTAPGRLIMISSLYCSINSETPVGSKVRITLRLLRS